MKKLFIALLAACLISPAYAAKTVSPVIISNGAIDSIQYYNASIGNFSALTVGSGLSFSAGTLSATGGGTLPYLDLTANPSPTYSAGRLYYDSGNESLTFFNNDSNVALQIGQEEWIRVTNNTGSTIPNGAAVYINGAASGNPTIALAQSNAAATTIGAGLTTEAIANGATGYVTSIGVVRGLDTSAFTAGQTVYISSTVAGGLTATAPTAPNYRYRVGIVAVSSATLGSIHVTPSTAALGNGTANQVFGMNAAGTAQEVKSIVGTASQVTITNTANTITASLPATINVNTSGSAATLTTGRTIAITGDLSYTSPSFNGSTNVTAGGTLATVNANVGSFTNANITVNAKGLITAAANGSAGGSVAFSGITSGTNTTSAMTVGTGSSFTYSGTGTITATHAAIANEATDTTTFPLFVTTSTGDQALKSNASFTFNSNTGDLGATSFSGAGTGLIGTASGLTAGTVTTNANLTGDVTSVGNATSIASGVIVDADVNAAAGILLSKTNISLTTTGTSGAATLNTTTGVLNVPNYASGGGSGTVTSVSASGGVETTTGSAITTTGTVQGVMPVLIKTGAYTVTTADRGADIIFTGGIGTITLPGPTPPDGFYVYLDNVSGASRALSVSVLVSQNPLTTVLPNNTSMRLTYSTSTGTWYGTYTASSAAITPAALTKTDDTNVTLTLGGTPSTALLQASSLTLGWSGTLSGTRGGTGVNNGASTITLGGSLTHAGAFTQSFTATGNTAVTLPTSGTLYGTATGSITSAQLATSLSDETGSGPAVFGTAPSISGATITTSTVNGVTLTAAGGGTNVLADNGTYIAAGSGSGTVNSGLASAVAYYPANGTTVDDLAGVAISANTLQLGTSGAATGSVIFFGSTSGSTTVQPNNAANGTIFIPNGPDTLVGKATTDTLTNKTYDTAGTGNSFSINGVAATANTGTGAVARATSPTFVTPTLGLATATSINKVVLTPPTLSTTLTLGNGSTLTTPNGSSQTWVGAFAATQTYTATTNNTFPAGTNTLYSTLASSITSAQLASSLTNETGTGVAVFDTSPTLTTPALGTPSALVGTNITGTAAGLTAGTATVANGLKSATTTVSVSAATAPTANQVLTASSSTAAAWVSPPFTGKYVSTAQTITSAGSLTLAHGLGVQPTLYQAYLKCVTAEAGYTAGDEVGPISQSPDNGTNTGIAITPDATNLNIRFGSGAAVFIMLNKSSGAKTTFTNANWSIIFRAWAS